MRFGQKIFLMSFTLIIITINVIGIIMINYSYKTNMDKEIEKNIVQINNIMRTMKYAANDISDTANVYLKNGVYIEIYIFEKISYTNFKEEYSKIAEQVFNITKQEEEGHIIKTYIQDERLFMLTKEDDITIITSCDISQISCFIFA